MTSIVSLYQKYRPSRLSEVIGQDHIKEIIEKSIINNKISHAYLFVGPRGTWKTSLARIMAKILNCENAPDANYSEDEQIIKTINEGKFLDIVELDAASNTSIEDIRSIIREAYSSPIMGKKKIFIIDEVHALSNSAISCLLKTLEEPPSSAVFFLCTTDPQKVKATIHSRCQVLQLKEISTEILTTHLEKISKKEGVKKIEKSAISLIARAARGSVRDSLSILQSVIGRGGEIINNQIVEEIVGSLGQERTFKLVKYIFELNKKSSILITMKMIKIDGKDPKSLFNSIYEMLHDMIIFKSMDSVETLKSYYFIDSSIEEPMKELLGSITSKEINYAFSKTMNMINDISNNPRVDFMLNSLIVSIIDGLSDMREKNKKTN